jgi:hypothetical protein
MKRVWIKQWISGFALAASVATGIFLIAEGNHRAAQDYYYNILPWGFWGAFFLALPFIAGAIWLLAAIVRTAAAEHQRYCAWKASLTPEQRLAVELAEAAAVTAAAIAMREHHRHTDARLTSSVMGRAMPDGQSLRPSDRIAAYRQQAALRDPDPQQPWGASDPMAGQPVGHRALPPGAPQTGDPDVPDPAVVSGRDPESLVPAGGDGAQPEFTCRRPPRFRCHPGWRRTRLGA